MRNALDKKAYMEFYKELSYKYPETNITLASSYGRLRIKYILDTLISYAEKGDLLLDAGCGGGVITIPYCQTGGRSVALDIGPGCVEFAKKEAQNYKIADKAQFIIGDICDLPFKERIFDIIVCAEVMEHLLEPDKAIGEFDRSLKPNGILIITVPNPLAMSFSFLRNIRVLASIIFKRVMVERVENTEFSDDRSDEYNIIPTLYKHRSYATFELKDIIPDNFKILKNKTIVSQVYRIIKNEYRSYQLMRLIERIPLLNKMGTYSVIVAQKLGSANNLKT